MAPTRPQMTIANHVDPTAALSLPRLGSDDRVDMTVSKFVMILMMMNRQTESPLSIRRCLERNTTAC
jgi:hypothetical protein